MIKKVLIHKVKQAYDFTPFYGESCVFDNSNLSISAKREQAERQLALFVLFHFFALSLPFKTGRTQSGIRPVFYLETLLLPASRECAEGLSVQDLLSLFRVAR